MNKPSQAGQALLVVVLVMVVVLTVSLSLASRSITNLRNTTDEANSQAAFAAAEAGVERALKLSDTTGSGIITGVNLQDKNNSQISDVSIDAVTGDQFLLNNGNPIFQDDGADVWLSPFDNDPTKLFSSPWGGGSQQTLTLDWGTKTDSCQEPAIELVVISGSRTSPVLSKYAFDSCAARRAGNKFTAPPTTGSFTVSGVNGSKSFNYQVQVAITNGLIARVIPLYLAGIVGIKGSGLPVQGKLITSTGTAGLSATQVVRKVTFFQGYEGLPSELYYGLFSAK